MGPDLMSLRFAMKRKLSLSLIQQFNLSDSLLLTECVRGYRILNSRRAIHLVDS